jgi:hypothetical protein
MQGQQAHTGEFDRGADSFRHRVWDVVEFQIEENLGASVRELFNCPRTLGCEELTAYLEESDRPLEFSNQSVGSLETVNIQGNDQSL